MLRLVLCNIANSGEVSVDQFVVDSSLMENVSLSTSHTQVELASNYTAAALQSSVGLSYIYNTSAIEHHL